MIESAKKRIRLLLARDSSSTQQGIDPARALREEVVHLEFELGDLARSLESLRADAAAAEQRAMNAIRVGDDRGARDALVQQRELADEATKTEADDQVLRGIVAECTELLQRNAGESPT